MTDSNEIPYPLELTTERLIIRSPSVEDAEGLCAAVNESLDALRPWMPWATGPMSLEGATENCDKAAKEFEEGSDHRLHFFLKETGMFLGGSGLHRIDWDVPRGEIGYWIRSSHTGRGYVTEAVGEITRYSFEELGAKRITITAADKNLRSWRVAERLGYELEGVLRNYWRDPDGVLHDRRVYSRVVSD